jgi:hypothetical protein
MHTRLLLLVVLGTKIYFILVGYYLGHLGLGVLYIRYSHTLYIAPQKPDMPQTASQVL